MAAGQALSWAGPSAGGGDAQARVRGRARRRAGRARRAGGVDAAAGHVAAGAVVADQHLGEDADGRVARPAAAQQPRVRPRQLREGGGGGREPGPRRRKLRH